MVRRGVRRRRAGLQRRGMEAMVWVAMALEALRAVGLEEARRRILNTLPPSAARTVVLGMLADTERAIVELWVREKSSSGEVGGADWEASRLGAKEWGGGA